VIGLAQLAAFGVHAKASRPFTADACGAHVAGAGADRLQRLGDAPGDELVVARCLGALAPLQGPLTVLAGALPGLLAGKQFGEHVRLAAPSRHALVALPPVAWHAVGAVQLDT
jgi:hypothetical protein